MSDGSRIEDLGINFRRIVSTILANYVTPEMPAIVARYGALRQDLARRHRDGAREPASRAGDERRPHRASGFSLRALFGHARRETARTGCRPR